MNKYKNLEIKKKYDNSQIMHYEITDIDRTLEEKWGDAYKRYRKEWDLATALKSSDKPLYIVMETNSYCNMRCKMCIRNFDNSKNRKVNVDMFRLNKILIQANQMGVPSFFVGAEAECLINPQIKGIIKMVKEVGGGIDNFLISNGYALNDEIIDLLIELEWERVYISLDAAKPETYKKIRGCDLNIVEKNIKRLIERRNSKGSMFPLVRVSFVIQDENRDEMEMFIEKWKDIVDIIDFQNLIHYENMEVKHNLPSIDYQCAYPFRTMLVDCDGMMYPCCTEWGYKMPIGNIDKMSLEDAWKSKVMNELRKQMLEHRLCDVCKSCAWNIEFK